jgi:serine/threonine protein kinase
MKKTTATITLDGFQVFELLGKGAAGSVYKARQDSTGQLVALKFLQTDGGHNTLLRQRQVARFQRETHLCAQLHHPHIVRLLDQTHTGLQQLVAVYEFVPGITLRDWLLQHGAMAAPVAGEIMAQLLDALACAHAMGIVHRDLKPQNIMLSETGASLQTKILDFGIATLVPEMQRENWLMPDTLKDAIGTPSYCAPEQLRGEAATARSDLYAWGLLFLECLTGKPAISGATLAETFHKQLSPQEIHLPLPLRHHPLGVLLRRVLQKDSRERAVDARSLYDELKTMNLSSLNGNLRPAKGRARRARRNQPQLTLEYLPGTSIPGAESRQITVLCYRVAITPQNRAPLHAETLEALQHDQLNVCRDTCQRFGARLVGALGDSQMFYFGYPPGNQDDAQRAARTVLALLAGARRRSRLLARQQGVDLEICIAVHTGLVFARPDHPPRGLTPDTAMRLNRLAQPGRILVSNDTRHLLQAAFEMEDAGFELAGKPVSVLLKVRKHAL